MVIALGGIRRITGNLFQERATGRFVPYSRIQPILREARAYGLQSAAGRDTRIARAVDTISIANDIERGKATKMFSKYITDLDEWKKRGRFGDQPDRLWENS